MVPHELLHVHNGKPRAGFFFSFRLYRRWLSALILLNVHLLSGTQLDNGGSPAV